MPSACFGFRDKTHGGRGDVRIVPDFFGERHLIARVDGDFRIRHHAAGTAINQVHAFGLQQFRQRDAVFDLPAALLPINRRDAHGQRQIVRPDFPHRARRVEQQADAIFKTAAVLVRALIGKRREKFIEQIPVRRVQFQPFKARRQRAFRRRDKIILHAGDVRLRHRARNFRQIAAERNRAGRNRFPAALRFGQMRAAVPRQSRRRLAACVRDLDARHRAVLLSRTSRCAPAVQCVFHSKAQGSPA